MATIDLRSFMSDEFVLHFGGRPNEVDAYTFGNSLIAFTDAIREINKQLFPDSPIEIVIDAVGMGSFRARVRTGAKKVSGLFKAQVAAVASGVAIGVLTNLVYDKIFSSPIQVITQDDSVIVQHGADRVIIPRMVFDAKKRLSNPAEIDRHISRGFDVLEEDPSVTDLGITPRIDDPSPVAVIPRDTFGRLATPGLIESEPLQGRVIEEPADLVVVRAVLERSERKWQFVWRGIRISAPIKDATFFDRLGRHEFEFGQGDILQAMLTIHQRRDDVSGAYINDWYEVSRVMGRIPGPKQPGLPFDNQH